MKRNTWLIVTISTLALGVIIADSLANTPTFPPAQRANFTMLAGVSSAQICWATPSGANNSSRAHIGIDGTGPYLAFWVEVNPGAQSLYTYRPRGQTANSVAHTGDGAIAAVEHFRKLYERWLRNQGTGLSGGVGHLGSAYGDFWRPACQIPPVGPASYQEIPAAITAEEWMRGLTFFVVLDPATNCFEDYNFEYMPGG